MYSKCIIPVTEPKCYSHSCFNKIVEFIIIIKVFVMQRSTVCVGKILMYVVGCDKQTMNIFQQISFGLQLDSRANYCHSLPPINDTSIIHFKTHRLTDTEMHLVFISHSSLSHLFVAELVQKRTEQSWHIKE